MRVLQLRRDSRRCVGIVDEDSIWLLNAESVFALAEMALARNQPLKQVCASQVTGEVISYDAAEAGDSGWEFLPCVDHPEPARCLISGTGLTHESSATKRDAMHSHGLPSGTEVTDSMRMYYWGVEAGRPLPGAIGVAPEWFFKGPGSILRAHLQPLTVPWHSEDGGEEAEIAGVYLVDGDGHPRRIGLAQGNEFSDHVHERKNYLYLAESKMRECSLGPELVLEPNFNNVTGEARILRGRRLLWKKSLRTGDAAMSHSLANIEHHHFKHATHRRPGDLHIHYFGAGAFSFGEGIRLQPGDVMQIGFQGFGRPLRNPIAFEPRPGQLIAALPL